MRRKLFVFLLSIILLITLPLNASATASLPMIVDKADLLSSTEEAALEETAQQLRSQFEMDIVILTVHSLIGKSAQDYADDYYDDNGYGYGAGGSGCLFLLAMEEREWYISTCGDTIYALTDYGIQTLGETALSHLSGDNYADVFQVYLSLISDYLYAYQNDSPIDGNADYSDDYYHGSQETIVYYEEDSSPSILLSLLIGMAAALVSVLVMRSSMNSRRKKHSASGYMKEDSFRLKRHQDLFLYSNVSKVRKQQNNSSGGSSVHRSSGGRSHGGGGGKF